MRTCAVAAVLIGSAAGPLRAQQPRPWLNWRTIETDNFVFHYQTAYRDWTMTLAERMEGVRFQVGAIVGSLPDQRVHIVVDDPVNEANGIAYTTLDAPTIVLYPTPPDPREEIGNFRVWNELLATHEFAHVAHLTRSSRNHFSNLLWSLSPVPLGPIATEAPRWVLEGYATYVEGKASGTGRPNNAWRAAILRQFAIEGRLPGYSQLSASGGWETGSFAYLAGSAYLEWLARRGGDSSITALWRRMTAKTTRSFDGAFIGVYGQSPAALYGRFAAEVTADALAFQRMLDRSAGVPGTLVQRLPRSTGDPAVSPDGRYVALAVRRIEGPSALVVWRTADEPDTSLARRQEAERTRDPEDVPDRSFFPAPKRNVISLVSTDGGSYETPRWMPDNRRLVVTRRVPLSDGSVRSDLYMWSAEDGSVSRITHGAALRNPDPSPDGSWAAAVRCDHGWCDLVRVDLASGTVRLLRAGSPVRNYYRPRVSRKTGEIIAAEQLGDRWRIVRLNPADNSLRYADPDDGATRYDAMFDVDGRSIVTTSEAGGIANLERIDPTSNLATRVSAVTGAAVGGDMAPDGTIWFLSLHASGYDLRRLHPDSASIARARNVLTPSLAAFIDSMSPVLPPRLAAVAADSVKRPFLSPVFRDSAYGIGPHRLRYIPTASASFAASAFQLAFVRTDPVGRLTAILVGSAGAPTLPQGVGLRVAARYSRNTVLFDAWSSHEAPSRQYSPALREGVDLSRYGTAARVRRDFSGDGTDASLWLGGLVERETPSALTATTRYASVGGFTLTFRQRDEDTRYFEQITTLAEVGQTEGGRYQRQRSGIAFGLGGYSKPITVARVSYGTLGGSGGPREQFVIGGSPSPLLDPVLDARRIDAPAYPVATLPGSTISTYRFSTPFQVGELFYAGASNDFFKTAIRSYGMELRERIASIPALGTPDINILAGIARAVDPPVANEFRYYLSVSLTP